MPSLEGNTAGLKPKQLKNIEKVFRRRIPADQIITEELARYLAGLTAETGRQLGVLINRQGRITHVMIGTSQGITIPSLHEYRLGHGRLRGLRCLHVHLGEQGIDSEDLADLAMLRLDLMGVITTTPSGLPKKLHIAHLKPGGDDHQPNYQILEPFSAAAIDLSFTTLIKSLEQEIVGSFAHETKSPTYQKAFIISVAPEPRLALEDSIAELAELARGAHLQVAGSYIQSRRLDPRTALGTGKLQEITISAMEQGIDLLIFDQELTPMQARNISEITDLKVIDRTLLILDIFARRAQSREGKLKVELAQLKYRLSWISAKTTALSRLTGGIGSRGPGETTLEIDRRRSRERITTLEKKLQKMAKSRVNARKKRKKNQLPLVSIVGYTNAGKSTLLNTLTKSAVFTENLPFATLDPITRKLRLPREQEIIITDTVGFIRRLPKDLLDAFRTTLEELHEADLLIHLVDSADEQLQEHMETVQEILASLDLHTIPQLLVFNKTDLITPAWQALLKKRYGGLFVVARDPQTMPPLLEAMASRLEGLSQRPPVRKRLGLHPLPGKNGHPQSSHE
ncbi:MAG: GTPase HflX [Deltaproteobacteria bacterium]|nr:GTPase HflX [Candidatus Anaeroferrophillus wilburensis]MBN2890004.1 GTPase HflX [Deltaproteobacteria bacterium]